MPDEKVEATADAVENIAVAEVDANKGASMQDFVKNSMNQVVLKDESETEVKEEAKEDTGTEDEVKKEDEETKVEDEVDETKPVPYERFKEVNEKAKQSETAVKAMRQEV